MFSGVPPQVCNLRTTHFSVLNMLKVENRQYLYEKIRKSSPPF